MLNLCKMPRLEIYFLLFYCFTSVEYLSKFPQYRTSVQYLSTVPQYCTSVQYLGTGHQYSTSVQYLSTVPQ
jgi:hypothetical protein